MNDPAALETVPLTQLAQKRQRERDRGARRAREREALKSGRFTDSTETDASGKIVLLDDPSANSISREGGSSGEENQNYNEVDERDQRRILRSATSASASYGGDDYHDEIKELIEPENLEQRYGGNLPDITSDFFPPQFNP